MRLRLAGGPNQFRRGGQDRLVIEGTYFAANTGGMGVPPRKRGLSAKQRHALAMLADAGQNGVTEAILMANGFKSLMLAHLDRKGLAAAMIGETMKAGAKSVEIVRLHITAAGRKAIEG